MFVNIMVLAALGDVGRRWRNAAYVTVSVATWFAACVWLAVPWLMADNLATAWVGVWLLPTSLCVFTFAWMTRRAPAYG